MPQNKREHSRVYYAANKHKWQKRSAEKQAEYNASRRDRYRTDAGYREREKQKVNQFRRDNPETVKHWKRQSSYGITPEQYQSLLESQGYRCAICGRPPAVKEDGEYKSLHVDHDHATGKVRGLLCESCNLGLGKFGDSPLRLINAAKYLQYNETTRILHAS